MNIKISEVFPSIQGEGRFQGKPVLFIRVSRCTRSCKFCDSPYHNTGKEYSLKEINKAILDSRKNIVVWTGGEPLLYLEQIRDLKRRTGCLLKTLFHLETNGDLITDKNIEDIREVFDYICVSPKDLKTTKRVEKILWNSGHIIPDSYDIKIVTDVSKVGVKQLNYATMLMPLTTYNEEVDKVIRQNVWDYCTENDLFYSARLHVLTWGKKKSI